MRRMIYLKVASLLFVMVLLVVVRVLFGSHKEFQKGEKASLEGRYHRAIVHYERAIRYYLPFNPYVSRSMERIWKITAEARERGEDWLAMDALRSLKGSLLATRSTVAVNSKDILKVEEEMKVLGDSPIHKSERVFPSDPLWSFITLFGFFCWSGGMVAFILHGPEKINWRNRRIIMAWFAFIGLGYILWLWGMIRA